MAKKKARTDAGTEVQEVTSKKARRRKARSEAAAVVPTPVVDPQPPPEDDPMSECAILCQQNRWREAALLLRATAEKAQNDGKDDTVGALRMVLPKVEYSLRRQMAAAFIVASKELLRKEYLLDVGE